MTVRPGDIRTKKDMGGGTLYDIGVYCINAARYLFRAEPSEVMAISVNSGAARLAEIDESTGALLRFDGERVAAFVTSFNAADVASYRIVGHEGADPRRSGVRVRGGPRIRADGRRQEHPQADRQARSVRAAAAVFLGLHPEEPRARAVGRGRSAGRADRRGALQVGGDRQGRQAAAVHQDQAAHGETANHPAGCQETGAGQGGERQRMKGAPGLPRRSAKREGGFAGSRLGH